MSTEDCDCKSRWTPYAVLRGGVAAVGLLLLLVGFVLGSVLAVLDPAMGEQYRQIGASLGGAGLFAIIVAWFM